MTDLEERVRDALRARAEEFTASPDAWERTRARAGRRAIRRQAQRPGRQRWLTRFTPLAAAAAVLVIGAGTAILAGTGGYSRSPAPQATQTATAPTEPTPPDRPPRSPGWIVPFPSRHIEEVPRRRRPDQREGNGERGHHLVDAHTGEQVPPVTCGPGPCQTHGGGASSGPEGPLRQGQLVRVDNASHGGLNDGNAANGIAAASVTSVEADLANGSVVRGQRGLRPRLPVRGLVAHLPARASRPRWYSATPPGRRSRRWPSPTRRRAQLKHPVRRLGSPAGTATDPCQQARVQQVMDGIKVWTYVGFHYPRAGAGQQRQAHALRGHRHRRRRGGLRGRLHQPAGQVARRIFVLNPTQTVSGVAVRGVTSVTAELADGRKYTGTFVNGKLFTYPVWLVSYPLKAPATLVFRNAAGKEVAVLHEPANP